MRIVFMGTPEFALPALEALARSEHRIVAAVTMPDRPRGRGHKLLETPVALAARKAGIPVIKPERAKDPAFLAEMERVAPDAVVLVAYGQIIPRRLLELPRLGCINLHPSLLPRHRGASPIHAPLLAGEHETGVTTMLMDEGLDTGPILLQRATRIGPEENAGDLHDRLAREGARLLLETLRGLERGEIAPVPQDDALATYAPKVHKEAIDWSRPADEVANRIRGLSPHPGAYTFYGGKRLKATRAVPDLDAAGGRDPGVVVRADEDGLLVAARGGLVRLLEVQPEGRSLMSAAEFVRGYRIRPGDRLA